MLNLLTSTESEGQAQSQPSAILSVDEKGVLSFIYADELAFLLTLGEATTKRASHVEPTDGNRWTADMSPVGGPVLGPFDTRQEALDAEVEWLKENAL